MIAEQTVLAHPVSFEPGSPKGKSPFIATTFKLLDGPDKGQTITAWLFLTDKTEARTAESLMACGWDGTDFQTLPGFGTKDVYLVIEHENYEGKDRAKVKWVNSADRAAGVKAEDKMSPQQVKGFASRMEAMAKAAKASAGAAPAKDATLKGSDGEDIF